MRTCYNCSVLFEQHDGSLQTVDALKPGSERCTFVLCDDCRPEEGIHGYCTRCRCFVGHNTSLTAAPGGGMRCYSTTDCNRRIARRNVVEQEKRETRTLEERCFEVLKHIDLCLKDEERSDEDSVKLLDIKVTASEALKLMSQSRRCLLRAQNELFNLTGISKDVEIM